MSIFRTSRTRLRFNKANAPTSYGRRVLHVGTLTNTDHFSYLEMV